MSRPGLLSLVLASLLLTNTARAQTGPHVLQIAQAASQFSFSGSASLTGFPSIPIQGNPSTFQISGTVDMDIGVAGGQVTGGQLVDRGSVVVVPTLNASVPNPLLPFLPPIATIRVTGLRVVFTSVDPVSGLPAPFGVTGGSFSTSVATNILAGQARISITGQPTQVVDLAGTTGSPQPITGTISARTNGLRLDVPIASTFSFVDPGGGGSGTLNLNGMIRGNDLAFAGDISEASVTAGGTQTLRLSAGTAFAGRSYLVLTSISGTSPGLMVNSVTLPLNPDPLLVTSAISANVFPWANTANNLDALGVGTASFTLPGGLFPALSGFTLNHAYLVLNSNSKAIFASNPVPLVLTP